jgi:hypothetical protein
MFAFFMEAAAEKSGMFGKMIGAFSSKDFAGKKWNLFFVR